MSMLDAPLQSQRLPSNLAAISLEFRPVEATDRPFLSAVYASTRVQELAQVDWSEAQKSAFLDMQFAAQHQHYHTHYTDTDYQVVLADGQACGRLYLARWPAELRVVDVSLLPAYRNQGLGSRILQGVIAEAAAAGKPVRIHVEHDNPARRLYRRLGFVPEQDRGVHLLMSWHPPASSTMAPAHLQPSPVAAA